MIWQWFNNPKNVFNKPAQNASGSWFIETEQGKFTMPAGSSLWWKLPADFDIDAALKSDPSGSFMPTTVTPDFT